MKRHHQFSRRDFVKKASTGIAAIASGVALSSCSKRTIDPTDDTAQHKIPVGTGEPGTPNQRTGSRNELLPKRVLGKTGMEVSMLAFGGGSQFMKNDNGKWEPLLERALAMGINYFDTSVDYNGSEERFSEILTPIRDQVYITSKFNGKKNDRRNVDAMKRELDLTLNRLKTDYLDVYMMHAIDNNDAISDMLRVFEEMQKLKEQGVIRHTGFSSMNSAQKSRDLIRDADFDVCMLAINPTTYGNYETVTMPDAIKKNMGVFAMKVMRDVVGKNGTTAEELMDWALDREGVAGAVIGHVGESILNQNAQIVMQYKPSSVRTWGHLEQRLRPYAGPHALCWAHPNYRDEFRAA